MFYDTTRNDHGLPYSPFKACVVPRPIGWISTISPEGVVNLAPYSYFNAVSDLPPMVMFSSAHTLLGEEKDSLRNIRYMKEFVVNIASYASCEAMLASSTPLPYGVSETEMFQIATVPSHYVQAPRVALSPIHMECRLVKIVSLEVDKKPVASTVVIGHVVGIHIQDEVVVDGKVRMELLQPVARLGYNEYHCVRDVFTMKRPD